MQIRIFFLQLAGIDKLAGKNARNPEIGKMVKALGDLMRASISGEDFITVRDEMKNVENYLTIQKFRYGDKIEAEMNISPEIINVKIPKLILQPIVENAIVHGIENKNRQRENKYRRFH